MAEGQDGTEEKVITGMVNWTSLWPIILIIFSAISIYVWLIIVISIIDCKHLYQWLCFSVILSVSFTAQNCSLWGMLTYHFDLLHSFSICANNVIHWLQLTKPYNIMQCFTFIFHFSHGICFVVVFISLQVANFDVGILQTAN